MVCREFIECTSQFLKEFALHVYFMLCWGMNVQNKIFIYYSRWSIYRLKTIGYDNSDLLVLHTTSGNQQTADRFSYAEKDLYLIHDSHSHSAIERVFACHLCPTWPVLPQNLSMLRCPYDTVTSEPVVYKLLMFSIPNLMPIFRCWRGREPTEIRVPLRSFVTDIFY
jgi:hypothetical protein